jgi:hypothetical protein
LKHTCRTPLIILAATLFSFSPGFAAVTSVAAETPPTGQSADATISYTVTQFFASEELRRAALNRLVQAGQWRELDERAVALQMRIDALAARAAAEAESVDPLDLDRQLRTMHRDAATIVDDLAAIVRRIEYDRNALDADARKWQEQTLFLEKQLVPAPVLEHARSIEVKLEATSVRIREYRDNVILALDRALVLQVRIDDARARIAAEQERVRAQRLQMQELPLWHLDAAPSQLQRVAVELRSTLRSLRDYLVQAGAGLAGVFFGALALTFWLFTRKSEDGTGAGSRAYGRPVAASLLIALMSLWWLALEPPVLFYEALLFLAPIPAAMVARNAFPAPIPLSLYGIAAATMLLVLRREIDASAIADRLLLLLQVLSIAVPLAIDLHKGRLQQALPRARPGAVRAAALFVIAIALITLFDVIYGPCALWRRSCAAFRADCSMVPQRAQRRSGAVACCTPGPHCARRRRCGCSDVGHSRPRTHRAFGVRIADGRDAGSGHCIHRGKGCRNGAGCRHFDRRSDRIDRIHTRA